MARKDTLLQEHRTADSLARRVVPRLRQGLDRATPQALKTFPQVTSMLAIVVGGLVLLGWQHDDETLKRVLPHLVAMNPTTALAFILAGVALLLSRDELALRSRPTARRVAQLCALSVAVVGLLKLCAIVLRWDFGVDQLLFRDKLAGGSAAVPNRMAPNTAFNFLLLGLALLFLDVTARRAVRAAQLLAIAVASTALVALVGYAYGISAFYGIGSYIPIAVHTALTFLLLALGLLLARPSRGAMAVITSENVAGATARFLLRGALGVPVVLGRLTLAGQRARLYDSEAGLVLFVVSNVLILATLVWRSSSVLLRVDREHRRAEARLARNALYDAATGLASRALFMDRLEHALARARRRADYRFAVLLVALGPSAGLDAARASPTEDQLLRATIQRLRACGRADDTIARLRADVFAVLLDGIADASGAAGVAKRILERLAGPVTLDGREVTAGATIGIVLNTRGHGRPDDIMRTAETALQRATAQGTAGYAICDP